MEEAKGFHVQKSDLGFNLFPGRINSSLACSPVSFSAHNESWWEFFPLWVTNRISFSKKRDSLDHSLFLGVEKIRSIEEKSEKLQEPFRSRVQAAVAAGLMLCQAQHMLCSRKGAFSPSAAYSLKSLVIACGVHYPGRANALTCSLWVYKCAKCCNENEVLLWMYFAIHSKGNIFSQVFGRNKVNNLARCALFVPYLLILFYCYIFGWFPCYWGLTHLGEFTKRETERFMTALNV